jgi:hypothetical protein
MGRVQVSFEVRAPRMRTRVKELGRKAEKTYIPEPRGGVERPMRRFHDDK